MSKIGRKSGIYTYTTFICQQCNTEVTKKSSNAGFARFCTLHCAMIYRNRFPKTNKVTMSCTGCSVEYKIWPHENKNYKIHFHSRACRREYLKKIPSIDISKLRDIVWDRDNGICQDCSSVRYLETHHIDGNKKHNTIDNLVLLCKKCHVHRHIKMFGNTPGK